MKFTNANSFKAKIKQIAKNKGITAQQVQQNYLIKQIREQYENHSCWRLTFIKNSYFTSY